jgi:hypothetical protein
MKFRKIRSLCLLFAAVVSGVSVRAQSEPSQATAPTDGSPRIIMEPAFISEQPVGEYLKAREEIASSSTLAAVGRPILFVHGCGGVYSDWYQYINSPVIPLRTAMLRDFPGLYQSGKIYVVWFDGIRVRFADTATGLEIDPSLVSQDVRLFVLLFYDPTQATFSAAIDPKNVVNISVAYKALELSRIVASIQSLTFVKDVTTITHSMGGVVARTYIEGLGGFGSSPYLNNIGAVVSLDAPHSGAAWTLFEGIAGFLTALPCNGLNRDEIDPSTTQSVIPALNYTAGHTFGGQTPLPISSEISLRAIKSYNTDLTIGGLAPSDGALTAVTQDVVLALQGNFPITQNFAKVENSFGTVRFPDSNCNPSIFAYLLHPILCVGVQPQTVQLLYDGILAYQSGVPLGVSAFSVANSVITGGANFSGTIALSTGAPPNGASVTISSTDASVQVPANITIAAGVASATFNMTSSAVVSPKAVTITASYGRGTQNASLTLQPAVAQVSLTSTSLDFSTQLIRSTSIGHVLSLTNSGTAPLVISNVVATGDFAQNNSCIGTVAVGASCAINVVFKPSAFGLGTGTLTITDSAPGSPHTIALSGTGIDIFLTMVRPGRPRRSNVASSNTREATFELNVSGGAADKSIGLTCTLPGSGEACALKQLSSNQWSVAVTSQHRASRLRQSQVRAVTINANVGNAVRSFSVPLRGE